jgi:N-methylhydantoinase A
MNDKHATIRIGIDVGGTFTDLFLLDEADGKIVRHKLPSTPDEPHKAPIQGIREILGKADATPAQVKFVGLGTTVATNALLERKGAVTGLITTKGFRDLLEIGRQKRPNAYDLFVRKAKPLVSRELRLEVEERTSPDGELITPLNEAEVLQVMNQLVEHGVTSVAICFLNSYVNPAHERRAAQLIRDRWPEISVTSSQELIPEFREYERMSSTAINAYLMPVMRSYLSQFTNEVRALGINEAPFVMASGGGIVTPALASRRPIDTLLSGPSGGVSAAIYLGQVSGYSDLITFDMGGTSTEACVIQDGRASITHTRDIDGLPMKSTAADVHTVGSGGSSIAWIDAGGMLRVGPHSAGSKPGPACYGNPDGRPTMTDANVVLGRLNREYLLDGALRIDASLSVKAIEEQVANPKGLSVDEAAAAILAVSNTSIAQAIRFVSVERGLDPSQFMLVAFGGAGPLHAADVARELNMAVLVPPGPGVLCAMGVLTKDTELDLSQTRLVRGLAESAADEVGRIYTDLERRATETFAHNNINTVGLVIEYTVDARYAGQSFELAVRIEPGQTASNTLLAIRDGFNAAHKQLYGYDKPNEEIELVTFRIKAALPAPKPNLAQPQTAAMTETPIPTASRRTYFESIQGFVDCPIFRRTELGAGSLIVGPAIIEQMDTTTIIPPDFQARVDEWGNLILRRTQGALI